MRRSVAVLLAVTMGFTFVACGDDDDGGEALSEEEFLEQGNALCQESNDDLDGVFEEAFGDSEEEPEAEEFAEVITGKLVPRLQKLIDDLRDLNPPESLKADYEELIDDVESTLDDFEEAAEDDPEALMSQEEDPFAEVNERAREMGLTVCGEEDE